MVTRPLSTPRAFSARPTSLLGGARPARLAGAALALVALVATLVGPVSSARAEERLLEAIAAQVGTDIVLASEVLEMSGPLEERMRRAGAPPAQIASVRADALERLIEGKLLSSVVERLELQADREEVDGAIQAIAEENGLTIEQLLTSVTSHGLTVDEYRDKIKGEIERSKVVNAMVRSRVELEEEEVQALFQERFGDQPAGGEEVYVRHIVVMPGGRSAGDAAAACRVAAAARAEIASGAVDFGEAAGRVSDMNPERGGDLGWLHRTELAPWMGDIIDGLEPGSLSPVIDMPFGCNLLELVDRRTFEPITYEQAAPRLQSYLFNKKTEEEYTKWLDVLRAQTYIDRKGAFGG